MGGNVWEWTERRIDARRYLRGGSFQDEATELRSDELYFVLAWFEAICIGLRVSQARTPVTADLNGDGLINGADVDSLVAEIAGGSNSPSFDLTEDGLVDIADLTEWRVQGGAANLPSGHPYLLGDANLDGVVDGQDFIAWNAHKFTSIADWRSGDFNADGVVDGQDFIHWNANKFTSADGANAVHEAGTFGLLLIAMVLSVGSRTYRSQDAP